MTVYDFQSVGPMLFAACEKRDAPQLLHEQQRYRDFQVAVHVMVSTHREGRTKVHPMQISNLVRLYVCELSGVLETFAQGGSRERQWARYMVSEGKGLDRLRGMQLCQEVWAPREKSGFEAEVATCVARVQAILAGTSPDPAPADCESESIDGGEPEEGGLTDSDRTPDRHSRSPPPAPAPKEEKDRDLDKKEKKEKKEGDTEKNDEQAKKGG
eukprot:Hpha_TRINITY_DN16866_c5_g1::TRINITY_DN16866_c5_g1_i1::g.150450::m.150450